MKENEVKVTVRSYRLDHRAPGFTEVDVDFVLTRIDNEDFEKALKEFVSALASGKVVVREAE